MVQKLNESHVPIEERAVEYIPLGSNDPISLTANLVQNYIAIPTAKGKKPSIKDCMKFVMLCKGKGANPFEGDAFMIGYDTQNGPSFSMVCGIELFLKRAENSPNYDGRESGIVIQKQGSTELIYREGALLLKDETLVGGWAKVYRKDHAHPEYKVVNFEVYNTNRSRWTKDPGGQIEKVALSQALRQAFPTILGGLYTDMEMERVTRDGDNIQVREPVAMPQIEAGDDDPDYEVDEPEIEEISETESGDGKLFKDDE